MKKITLFITAFIMINSCKEKNKPVICTEMFAMVGAYVIGDSLTNFYTERQSNNEIINNKDQFFPESNWYPVLTDLFVKQLKNKQEKFLFVGLKNNDTLVKEEYIISADECHINKVSGKDTIFVK